MPPWISAGCVPMADASTEIDTAASRTAWREKRSCTAEAGPHRGGLATAAVSANVAPPATRAIHVRRRVYCKMTTAATPPRITRAAAHVRIQAKPPQSGAWNRLDETTKNGKLATTHNNTWPRLAVTTANATAGRITKIARKNWRHSNGAIQLSGTLPFAPTRMMYWHTKTGRLTNVTRNSALAATRFFHV